jgi:hypothetical protein
VSVIIPKGYSNFYLTMFNIDESISQIPDDYFVMVFFEIDE